MYGIHVFIMSQPNDPLNIEISLNRPLPLSYEVGIVGFVSMKREGILLRVDGDCADAKLCAGTKNTYGNLSAVCHHNPVEWSDSSLFSSCLSAHYLFPILWIGKGGFIITQSSLHLLTR